MNKKGVSSVIAVVLIIMIVVVSISIVWMAVLPMVQKSVSVGCTDVDLSIGSEGYTCYSPDSLTAVQVKKGPNNVNVAGVKIGLSSSGNTISYFTDYKFQPNTQKTFYLNSSTLSSIDKISLVAIYNDGKNRLECPSVYMENALTKRCDLSKIVGSGALIIQPNGTCVANCSCANQTIIGQNCTDNLCGMNCTGTKVLPCVSDCSCNLTTWVGTTCPSSNGCGLCQGTKQDGSLSFPFVITNCLGLQNISSNLVANYTLLNDIDCSDTINWNWNGTLNAYQGFVPIGNYTIDWPVNYFRGSLNGDHKIIYNLFINRPSTDDVGLFGYIYGANLTNVGLVNVNIRGNSQVGGLVGQSSRASRSPRSVIFGSYTTGNVVASADYVGGLIGSSGVVAINNSYSTAVVNGNNYTGGLIGFFTSGNNISNSYATGNVNGASYVGGLAGYLSLSCAVNNSYSTGNVVASAEDYVGGLIGRTLGKVSNSYWYYRGSGDCCGWGFSCDCTSETDISYFYHYDNIPMNLTSGTGWDFTNVWSSSFNGASYPTLK